VQQVVALDHPPKRPHPNVPDDPVVVADERSWTTFEVSDAVVPFSGGGGDVASAAPIASLIAAILSDPALSSSASVTPVGNGFVPGGRAISSPFSSGAALVGADLVATRLVVFAHDPCTLVAVEAMAKPVLVPLVTATGTGTGTGTGTATGTGAPAAAPAVAPAADVGGAAAPAAVYPPPSAVLVLVLVLVLVSVRPVPAPPPAAEATAPISVPVAAPVAPPVAPAGAGAGAGAAAAAAAAAA